MPGQTVNTLFVPVQHSLRKRSASLSSMRGNDFMTTNPRDKYTTPRPAPRAPLPALPTTAAPRLDPHARQRSASRSVSPAPSWKRFFRRGERCATPEVEAGADAQPGANAAAATEVKARAPTPDDDARSSRSCSTARSRDMSPECLRRFLCDEGPSPDEPPAEVIPEEVEEELEGDDDENFAEAGTATWGTVLAPPPIKRAVSAPQVTCSPPSPPLGSARDADPEESPVLPDFENRSRFSFSSVSSCASSDAGTPPLYDLPGEARASYELPATGKGKRAGSFVGVDGDLGDDLQWMVDVIRS